MKKVLLSLFILICLMMVVNCSSADDWTGAWGDESGNVFLIGRNYDAGTMTIVLYTQNYFYFLRNVMTYFDPKDENTIYIFSDDTTEFNEKFFIKAIMESDQLSLYIEEWSGEGKFKEPLILRKLKY